MPRFTERYLANFAKRANVGEKVADDDCRGLRIRKNKDGSLSYVIKIRVKYGRSREYTLGRYQELTIEDVRSRATEYRRLAREGIDPADEIADRRREHARIHAQKEKQRLTLREALNEFSSAKNHAAKSKADYLNTFENHCRDWLDRPVVEISKRSIEKRLQDVRGDKDNPRHPATAAKLFRYLKAVLSYCTKYEIDEDVYLLDRNPAEKVVIQIKVPERELLIGKGEVSKIIEAVADPASYAEGAVFFSREYMAVYLVIALFTGLRLNEICNLRWEDIELEGDNPFIYVRTAKRGKKFVVPITKRLMPSIMEQHSRSAQKSDWVFPSNGGRQPKRPMSNPSKNIRAISKSLGVPFTSHDLRHLFASTAFEIGIEDRLLQQIMHHGQKDVTDRYIHATAERTRKWYEQIQNQMIDDWDSSFLAPVPDYVYEEVPGEGFEPIT